MHNSDVGVIFFKDDLLYNRNFLSITVLFLVRRVVVYVKSINKYLYEWIGGWIDIIICM